MFFFRTVISFLQDDEYRDLLITTFMILLIGTLTYHYLEGWGIIDSLYFSVVTLTTIGYGDFTPKTDAGKLFTVLYIIVGIGMILSFINTIQHHYTYMKYREKKEILKTRNLKKIAEKKEHQQHLDSKNNNFKN
ncbi:MULTISPECIES: potassium channel family protein [Flavobacterium]|uniref:Potassium channel family protein n=1 Tax=Flavobacterium jumunjinense TaxID=998845 RepID=A0ABV5GTU2_9FLAO|nr:MULTISPECIES: potassium channel family protein [Flavobacterium]